MAVDNFTAASPLHWAHYTIGNRGHSDESITIFEDDLAVNHVNHTLS